MRPYDALINRFLEIIQEVRGGANTDREKELLDEVKSLVDQIDEKEFSVQRIPPKSINISSLPPEQRKGIDLAMKEMRVQPCALEALERARKFNEQNSLGKSISSYGQDSIKTLSVHGREFEIYDPRF